jgi:ankyrin repeat protein
MTPLHCALLKGRVSATEALLSVGASVVKKSASLQSPVELAIQSKSLLAFIYMAFISLHNQFAFMLLDALKEPGTIFKVVNTVFKVI